jgi:hypothetical protein
MTKRFPLRTTCLQKNVKRFSLRAIWFHLRTTCLLKKRNVSLFVQSDCKKSLGFLPKFLQIFTIFTDYVILHDQSTLQQNHRDRSRGVALVEEKWPEDNEIAQNEESPVKPEALNPAESDDDESAIGFDWGRSNPNWIRFTASFPAGPRYRKVVDEILCFHELRVENLEDHLMHNFTKYLQECHDAGAPPTTLRSRITTWRKFCIHTGRLDLSTIATLTETKLAEWDRAHSTKRAAFLQASQRV